MIFSLEDKSFFPVLTGAIATLAFVLYSVYVAFSAPSAPGAVAARFSRLWYFRHVWRGRFEKENIELHRKYGSIVRVGPRDYVIDDPDAVKSIYGHGTQFKKSDWYSAFGPPEQAHINLFSLSNIKAHAAERRKLASMYAMSTLLSYEPHVDKCIKTFCERLDAFSDSKEKFSMAHYNQCFAFDVIGEITLGQSFGFLETGHDIGGIMQGLESFTARGTLCGIYLWLGPIFFGGLLDNGATRVVGWITDTMRKKSVAHGSEEDGTPTFLTKLNGLNAKDPATYTPAHIFAGCGQNIIAGSDTTSISLNAIFYHMFKQPRVFAKLRAEIDEFCTQAEMGPADFLSFEQAQKMRYLQAVIKEGLRVHSAVGLPLWRVVPQGGAELAGTYFPAGVNLGVNPWAAHYNTSVFGDDADLFRPERWLDSPPEQLAAMDRYYMPFGLGSRTCIGKNISLLEMSKLVPELVRRYNYRLAQEEWSSSNYWFVKQRDFDVWITRRNDEKFAVTSGLGD